MNIADEPLDHLMLVMRRIHERAVMDFDAGRSEGYRTGQQLLELAGVTESRGLHLRLASTIYNTTIRSLRVAGQKK